MKNIQIILLFFVFGCTTNKEINIFYENKSNETIKNILYEKQYNENSPAEYRRQEDEILLFFSGLSFQGSKIVVNKKDTLIFKEQTFPTECLGFKLYKIKKKNNYLLLKSDKYKKILKLKIDDNYNYATIGNSLNNFWAITYYPFFPNITCR